MSKKAEYNLNKLTKDFESVFELASIEARKVIEKVKTLTGRRRDNLIRQLEKMKANSAIALETRLIQNPKFAREALAS